MVGTTTRAVKLKSTVKMPITHKSDRCGKCPFCKREARARQIAKTLPRKDARWLMKLHNYAVHLEDTIMDATIIQQN